MAFQRPNHFHLRASVFVMSGLNGPNKTDVSSFYGKQGIGHFRDIRRALSKLIDYRYKSDFFQSWLYIFVEYFSLDFPTRSINEKILVFEIRNGFRIAECVLSSDMQVIWFDDIQHMQFWSTITLHHFLILPEISLWPGYYPLLAMH